MYTELINIIKNNSSVISPESTGVTPVLSRIENIKSVIFDVYGTMVISASGDIGTSGIVIETCHIKNAAEKAGIVINNNTPCEYLNDLFYSLITEEHKKLRSAGITHPEVNILSIWKDYFSELFNKDIVKAYPSKESIIMAAVYFEIYSNPVWPMPGLSETLKELKQRNFVTGIISNAQFYTPIMIEALTGKSFSHNGFQKDLIFYSFNYSEAKPSVFMFEKLKDRLYNNYGINEYETVYIGNDMRNDILTAGKCGFKTVLFAGDKRSLRIRKNEHPDVRPDAVITELHQLLEIIGEIP